MNKEQILNELFSTDKVEGYLTIAILQQSINHPDYEFRTSITPLMIFRKQSTFLELVEEIDWDYYPEDIKLFWLRPELSTCGGEVAIELSENKYEMSRLLKVDHVNNLIWYHPVGHGGNGTAADYDHIVSVVYPVLSSKKFIKDERMIHIRLEKNEILFYWADKKWPKRLLDMSYFGLVVAENEIGTEEFALIQEILEL